MPKFVDIETPYASPTSEGLIRNIRYARACVRDSLSRGEIPFASHLFYTQPGVLDDTVPAEREKGIEAGKIMIEALHAVTVVYTDLGISNGMRLGIERAKKSGRNIEERTLGDNWEEEFSRHERNHAHINAW